MKPKSAIQKGKLLEDYIADQIKEKGLDPKACRSAGSGSGNREKADINTSLVILGRNVGIEAKNHKVPHIKDWWKQTQKLEVLGREPVLVYKLAGESFGDSKAVIYLNTLLDLIKLANTGDFREPVDDKTESREMLWKLNNLKNAIKQLEKELK